MSTANRDLSSMQSLNDDLKLAYQELIIQSEQKDEEIAALRQKVRDLQTKNAKLVDDSHADKIETELF